MIESKIEGERESWQNINVENNLEGESQNVVLKGDGKSNSDTFKLSGGPLGGKPNLINLSGNPVSPNNIDKYISVEKNKKGDCGAPLVPDLNNTLQSFGFFPFVDSEDNLDDEFDFGDDDVVEQSIEDEIERRRRHKKKGEKKSKGKRRSNGESSRSKDSSSANGSSYQEEIEQTMKIGEELGVQFNGKRSVVQDSIHREGARMKKC
ncbi:hypothetical protein L1887_24018 [Cichorium endivia]|nr:hypothetical protein L1887_24018 [Cichorium endivia]